MTSSKDNQNEYCCGDSVVIFLKSASYVKNGMVNMMIHHIAWRRVKENEEKREKENEEKENEEKRENEEKENVEKCTSD